MPTTTTIDMQTLTNYKVCIFCIRDRVVKQFHSTGPKYTTGVDGHSAIFYVNCSSGLALPRSMFYNLSMCTSTIPSEWKRSVITHVFKRGSSNDPSNYRPIASTCTASEIMEGCVKI